MAYSLAMKLEGFGDIAAYGVLCLCVGIGISEASKPNSCQGMVQKDADVQHWADTHGITYDQAMKDFWKAILGAYSQLEEHEKNTSDPTKLGVVFQTSKMNYKLLCGHGDKSDDCKLEGVPR